MRLCIRSENRRTPTRFSIGHRAGPTRTTSPARWHDRQSLSAGPRRHVFLLLLRHQLTCVDSLPRPRSWRTTILSVALVTSFAERLHRRRCRRRRSRKSQHHQSRSRVPRVTAPVRVSRRSPTLCSHRWFRECVSVISPTAVDEATAHDARPTTNQVFACGWTRCFPMEWRCWCCDDALLLPCPSSRPNQELAGPCRACACGDLPHPQREHRMPIQANRATVAF